jgi:glycyl-tRNA synthetase
MTHLDEVVSLAKRRGFFWPSCEIYGAIGGFYDYGHLGVGIKRKWEDAWRRYFLSLDSNFYEIGACDLMPEEVFIGSGHMKNFVDPIVECARCHAKVRADHLIEDNTEMEHVEAFTPRQMTNIIHKFDIRCPRCKGKLKEVKLFNMILGFDIGATLDRRVCARPETAQGPYVNFKQMFEVTRRKLPLGLCVIGKAYRNEISPRKVLYRLRELTQAELQIFFDPKQINQHEKFAEIEDKKLYIMFVGKKKVEKIKCKHAVRHLPRFYLYYMAKMQDFFFDVMNIPKERFRWRELSKKEKAFYNKYHFDAEVDLEGLGGFSEIAGLHYRTDHDLGGHQKNSNENLTVYLDKRRFIPHVIELSFGVDRCIYTLLDLGLKKVKKKNVLKLPKKLAPILVSVFPLLESEKALCKKAREVYEILRSCFDVSLDESGSIGRRYARADEIGVPFCVTIDHQTLEDETVTIRDRDTKKQIRVKIKDLSKKIYTLTY